MTRFHNPINEVSPHNRNATFTKMDTRDIHEAMAIANHDFTVEMAPLYLPNGQKVWDKNSVLRNDGAYLGTVGLRTRHIQPLEFYQMADNLIKSTNGRIITGITMNYGSVIGMVISIDKREYVPNDVSELTVIMLTSYNSKFAILGRAIINRFICLNQIPSSTKLFNIKNTTNNLERLNMATRVLSYYGDEVRGFDSKMKLLTSHKMSDARAIEWFGSLLPTPKEDSKRANTLYDNKIDLYTNLLQNGLGSNIPNVRGTAYGAFQALTELQNHHAHTRVAEGKSEEEVRFESNLLGGSGDNFMGRGFKSIVKIAETTPSGSLV